MNELILHSLRKKQNSHLNTYNAMKISQILYHYKSQISLQYYEYTQWNLDIEHLKKFYQKEISWALLMKILWFYGTKKNSNLLPLFRSFYWMNYILKYTEVKFEFVNYHKFNDFEDLDVSLKTFFNEDTNDEIEKEEYISMNIVSEIKKKKKKETDKSFEDIMALLTVIDYTDRVSAIKKKEKRMKNEQETDIEIKDEKTKEIFRRKTRRKFGCVIIRNGNNNANNELNNLLFQEEEKAVLAMIKPKPKQNEKFKSVYNFMKVNRFKNGLKIHIHKDIKQTLLLMYKENDYFSNNIEKPKINNKKIFDNSFSLSFKQNYNTLKTNNDYHSLTGRTIASINMKNKAKTHTEKFPQVYIAGKNSKTIEQKPQFFIALKKKPHVLQGLLSSSPQCIKKVDMINSYYNHQTMSDYQHNDYYPKKMITSKPLRSKILIKA